jgi:prepilin-type N-terminal cleavage/methylation domain-containing protein
MSRTSRPTRRAFTLVEVVVSTAMLAVLTTSSFALVRTAHDAWRRHRNDAERRREAVAVLQHVVRRVRQATEVAALSAPADLSGSLTLMMPDGTSAIWDHDSATSRVYFGSVAPNNLLATGVAELNVVALSANGALTTTPALARSVRCTLKYTLDRPAGPTTETVTCLAWLRSW